MVYKRRKLKTGGKSLRKLETIHSRKYEFAPSRFGGNIGNQELEESFVGTEIEETKL